MIPITTFNNIRVMLFGLGKSGIATAKALLLGGAKVIAFDEDPKACELAIQEGITICDLRSTSWRHADALLLSPGIPLTHPTPHWIVKTAKEAEVEIIGDIELLERERRARGGKVHIIAITGTNGKSTTVALTSHMLQQAGIDVQMGGNIGYPLLTLGDFMDNRYYVIEVSSFQADLTTSLKPEIGIITNISSDHLDRHHTMDNYIASKKKVVANASLAIISTDDQFCKRLAKDLEKAVLISTQYSVGCSYHMDGSVIVDSRNQNTQSRIKDICGIASLRGQHNAQNAMCATAIAQTVGLEPNTIANGLESFPGLPHRIETIKRIGHITFINDSKSTNATATKQALTCLENENIYWIVGGEPKSDGIASLTSLFFKITKAYLIGSSTEKFAIILNGKVPYKRCDTIDQAVISAARDAQKSCGKATVLLSPACSSFDQFSNFEERGNAFRELVHYLSNSLLQC